MSSPEEKKLESIVALEEQGAPPSAPSTDPSEKGKDSEVPEPPQVAGPLNERQVLMTVLKAIEENSEGDFLKRHKEQKAAALKEANHSNDEKPEATSSEKGKARLQIKSRQKGHLDEHRKKKATMRRRLQMHAADVAQDAEPSYTSQSDALGHLEYMDISEPVEVDLPSELAGFATMGLAANEVSGSGSDKEKNTAAAQQSTSEDANNVPATGYPYLIPTEEPKKDTEHSMSPPVKFSAVARPGARGNLICRYAFCPIMEEHYEGPYYYKGVFGDQNHSKFRGSNPPPWLWEYYYRVINRTASWHKDNKVHSFWLWHVSPFCHIPDYDEHIAYKDTYM